MMKKCKFCNSIFEDNLVKCPSCGGNEFFNLCSKCGSAITIGNSCPNCGYKKATKNKKLTRIIIPSASVIITIVFLIILFTLIIPNSDYRNAIALYEDGNYSEAVIAFQAMNGYKDSDNYLMRIKIGSLDIGEKILFGRYEQDNDLSNGPEEIEWRILAKKDGKALLLSEYALDSKPYHEWWEETTWEKCSLRAWLNDSFFKSAFNDTEKLAIVTTSEMFLENPEYNTYSENNTQDNIFLLSVDDIFRYLRSSDDNLCFPTEYAISNGAFVNTDNGSSWWWLRLSEKASDGAPGIAFDGCIDDERVVNYFPGSVVRPALWLNFESEYSDAHPFISSEN